MHENSLKEYHIYLPKSEIVFNCNAEVEVSDTEIFNKGMYVLYMERKKLSYPVQQEGWTFQKAYL